MQESELGLSGFPKEFVPFLVSWVPYRTMNILPWSYLVICVLAAYIVFREYRFAKRRTGEGARKPETTVRETKESEALKKREKIYRRAAEKDKSAVTQLLTQLKDESPMVRLAAAR